MKKTKVIVILAMIVGSIVTFLSIFFTVAHFTFQYYEGEKVFAKSGLSISLTRDFKENDVSDYTAHYTSEKLIVLTLKVEFDRFDTNKWNPYEHSCLEYTEKISKEYKELYSSTTEPIANDSLIYFTFDFEQNGKNYKYLLATYKANDAYWQVIFGCEKRDFESLQKDMLSYAKSVNIGDKT